MEDERWKAAFELLERAQELPVADRQEFIESQTADVRLREILAELMRDLEDQQPEPDHLPRNGDRIGPYEVVSQLGAGGSGHVFRARDSELDRYVALKFLANALLLEGKQATERLVREAKTASALNHPHIITIHGIVREPDGRTAIAMEWVDGVSLREFCTPGTPQPLARVLRWGRQIASALGAAHAASIVHRDIKPENLIVRRADDNVKILDFGLARRSRLGGEGSRSLLGGGTIDYVSPEQATGGSQLTPASDIFSLGTLLYELAVGRHPFAADTPLDRLYAICQTAPPSASAVNADVPPGLASLLARMAAKDAAARPSAVEVEAALASLETQSSAPVPPAAAAPAPSPAGRWWTAVAAALLAALAGGLSYRALTPRPRPIDSVAVLRFTNPDPSLEHLAAGLRHEIALRLATTPGLRVVTSAAATHRPPAGADLGVGAVVAGALARSGASISLDIELLDAHTGAQLWSGQFAQRAEEIAAFPQDVSRRIAARLGARAVDPLRRTAKHPPAAYEAYLLARYHFLRRTRPDMALAAENCERALAIDPGLAEAWALLAASQGFTPGMYNALSPAELYAKTRHAIAKAVSLDPDLPEVHLISGGVKLFQDRDWAGAERELRRAVALNPNEAQAHLFLAILMRSLGRKEEERRFVRQAAALDPESVLVANHVAWTEYFHGNDSASATSLARALQLDPAYSSNHTLAGYLHLRGRRFPEAIAAFQKATKTAPGRASQGDLGYAYAVSGNRPAALEILRGLQQGAGYTPAGAIAWIHLGLGDFDRAMAWIEKATGENYQWLNYVRIWPVFDPLRADPRMPAVLRQLRLD